MNTRRLAERVAHHLAERLGEEQVAAHHGSLSKERRLRVEERLKAGELRALVATASLELGIDIGPVELVCQIGSPRSLATLLQRVGRSGHARGMTPKGRLFPPRATSWSSARRGARRPPRPARPRAAAARAARHPRAADRRGLRAREPGARTSSSTLVRRAAPYAALSREDFDAVVELVSEGVQTGRGRRGAHLHRDRVNGMLRGRRGARIAALTSGGAIPEIADYRVVLDPDDTFIGTVNEDWAIESMAGDIFLLGSTSWRIRRVEPRRGARRGRAAARRRRCRSGWARRRRARASCPPRSLRCARTWRSGSRAATRPARRRGSQSEAGLDAGGAEQVVRYLAAGRQALGVVPTHAGRRVRALLRRRGRHAARGARAVRRARQPRARAGAAQALLPHVRLRAAGRGDRRRGGALARRRSTASRSKTVRASCSPATARETLEQALLLAPMFGGALALERDARARGAAAARRQARAAADPAHAADDLMAAVFPALAACQENAHRPGRAAGPPADAPDAARLPARRPSTWTASSRCSRRCERREMRVHARDTTEPSPFSHEILNAQAVHVSRRRAARGAAHARRLDPARRCPSTRATSARSTPRRSRACASEARPEPRDAEELHDALLELVVRGARARVARAGSPSSWRRAGRRASRRPVASAGSRPRRGRAVEALFPGAALAPDVTLPAALAARPAAERRGRRRGGRARPSLGLRPGHRRRARRTHGARAVARRDRARAPRGRGLRAARALLAGATGPRSSATGACSRASIATRSTACAARSSR